MVGHKQLVELQSVSSLPFWILLIQIYFRLNALSAPQVYDIGNILLSGCTNGHFEALCPERLWESP